MNALLLAVVLPFAAAAVAALAGHRWRAVAPLAAAAAPAGVLWVAASSLAVPGAGVVAAPWTSPLAEQGQLRWFVVAERAIAMGWAIDSLAALMLAVVGVVALCVVVFSVGYMGGDAGWARYFALIALFTGSMSLLVIGDSLATLFVGWELVGACSYLLIGFWYERPGAVRAATKAFLTTRVGDVGLLVGIAILWTGTGSLAYQKVIPALHTMAPAAVAAAAICLVIGAMGKSAQFPLHGWLPDAMEGPTPVSALIHAATMVAAGVYLGARVWPLFEMAPEARALMLAVGVISAVGSALVATVQHDIKKVLAYSTISQLGFMFAALGAGSWEAAFFHLMAHAGFKALLFLGSGSVIHGTGTQDIRLMGGLRRSMPVTFGTWLVGVLALAGIAPLSGFFSKDAVLEVVWHTSPLAGGFLFAASAVTAFYAARVTRLAFFGPVGNGAHAHEATWSMATPLLVLAVPAATLGFGHSLISELLRSHADPLSLPVSVTALALAAVGGTLGLLSAPDRSGDESTRRRLGPVGDVLAAAYGWDRLVDRLVVAPVVAGARGLWAVGDRLVADGAVMGVAGLARWAGGMLSRVQRGDGQSYAAAIVITAALMLALLSWTGR